MTSHIDQIHDNFQAEASTSLCVDISLQSDYSDIPQCDGADTVSNSSLNHSISNIQVPNYSINNIPVVTSVARPPAQQVPMTTRVLTAINRNERVHTSATFPVIAVANVHSFLPKLNSTIEKIMMEEISVLLLNEVWEKTGRKNCPFPRKNARNAGVTWPKIHLMRLTPIGEKGRRGRYYCEYIKIYPREARYTYPS
jgi:hypothetical protein